ncbi:MAG: Crp/Fnr family transcriptional regulator [Sphingomicrobium sp.]|nr:Crp/Fnr family transcriptional regulator [Sphingomonadales bacterium]
MNAAPILEPMVRKLELWGPLEEEDRAALLALPYTLREIPQQGYIVRDGDRPTHSCALLRGYAFRQKIVADGERQILAVQIPGDLVDLQNSLLPKADHSVQALTRVEVAYIPREPIVALAFERPAIGKLLWFDTLVDGSIAREWITNIGRRDAYTRIAHLLCEFALRLEKAGIGERDRYELPMTQEQIADATGLTAVHVNRTLRTMDESGFLTRDKRSVVIHDWARLAQAGDFSSGYLHFD